MKLVLGAVFVIVIAGLGGAYAQSDDLPAWIKNTALWYGEGSLTDHEFLNMIQFLIDNQIITVPNVQDDFSRISQLETELSNLKSKTVIDIQEAYKYGYNDGVAVEPVVEPVDDGNFYVTYYDNPNHYFEQSAKEWIQQTVYFENQIQFINSQFRLPYDVEIVVMECNVINAFYDPSTKQIIMCYELFDHISIIFEEYYKQDIKSPSDLLNRANLDVIDWIFYHEMGHALIDIYQLPVTGLEENVADQFAAYVLLEYTVFPDAVDNVQNAILVQDIMFNVGTMFFIEANSGKEHVYWTTHNLDIQRFYNVSCYAYGHSPEYNLDLITEGWLPQERAENCEYEYAVLKDSWDRILAPYMI